MEDDVTDSSEYVMPQLASRPTGVAEANPAAFTSRSRAVELANRYIDFNCHLSLTDGPTSQRRNLSIPLLHLTALASFNYPP